MKDLVLSHISRDMHRLIKCAAVWHGWCGRVGQLVNK